MGFRQWLSSWRASPQASVQSSGPGRAITTSAELDAFLREGNETASGQVVTPEIALRIAAVYRCVAIIAGAVATMPIHIKRRVDARTREDVDGHPAGILMRRRPNAWMTASAFRRMMTAHVLLRGNAYAVIVRSAGKPIDLIPIHPDRVIVEQADDLAVRYIYQRKDGRRVLIDQSDMLHLLGMTFDGVRGVSPIQYARETIGFALATQRHGATLFKNGTQIGAVLKHPKALGNERIETLRAGLEKFRGGDNAHKTMILEEGMEFSPIGMTAEDAQYIETMKYSRSDIAMFMGVPPHMIGDTEKSTSWGSGIEQQHIGFLAYTLEDWLTSWEETIGRALIVEPDHFARFNRAALVRSDIKTRYGAYQIGRTGGWLSANDIRAAEDMNPIEGGDTYLEPLNMQPADANTRPQADPEPTA